MNAAHESDGVAETAPAAAPQEHATEFRRREISDSFCTAPGCEYEGKPAVQGHCFSRLDDATDRYLREKEASALSILAHLREQNPAADEYVKALESYYVCSWMNGEFTLDELVRLRRDNAALRAAADRRDGASPERPSSDVTPPTPSATASEGTEVDEDV